MATDKGFIENEPFDKRVGLLNEEQLLELGWECDNGNRICFSQAQKLLDFMNALNAKGGKQYHIATDLLADELEADYCEENNIDPDDENRRVVAELVVNRMAYVNRMDYYLCDGDDDEELYLRFVEEL